MIDVDFNPLETEDGVWTTFEGTRLKIANVNCMAFQRKFAKLQQPYAKRIASGTLGPDIQKDILCEAMAGTILQDGEFSSKGEQVPFTPALAKKILMERVDVRDFITEFSGNLDNFRKEEAQEVGKPS